jgi:hypothetical protein
MEARPRPPYVGVQAILPTEPIRRRVANPTTQRSAQEDEVRSHPRFAKFSAVTVAVSAIAAALGVTSATLGAPVGAIVLSEMCGFACAVAFTLLIWAAIQDGRQSARAAGK